MFQCHNNIGVTALHHWAQVPETGEEGHDRGGVKNFQESFPFYCIYLVSGKYHCHSIVLCVSLIYGIASLLHPPWVTPTSTESNCSPLWSICSASLQHGMDQHYNIGRPTWQNMCHISQNICTNFPLCTLTNNDEEQDLTMAMEGVK